MRFIEITGDTAPEYRFVCKAVSNEKIRYYLNFVYCQDDKLIGTDGRRIHLLNLIENPHGFKNGSFYRILKATAKMVWLVELDEAPGQFPNYERVLPGKDYTKTVEYQSIKRNSNYYSHNIAKISKLFKTSAMINIVYLDDLPEDNIWTVHFYDVNKALLFVAGNKTAAIMPMQGDDQ